MRSVNSQEQKDRPVKKRRCIATGRSQDRDLLIRFVLDSCNRIRFDLSEKFPGRGIWVSSSRECIQSAISKNLFQRVSRCSVSVPKTLTSDIENNLAKRLLFTISQARRCDLLVCEKRERSETMEQNQVIISSNAQDKLEFGDQNLDYLNTRHKFFVTLRESELIQGFSDEKLCTFVINEAKTGTVTMENLAQRLIRDFYRLAGFRLNLAFGGLEKSSEGCIDSLGTFAGKECAVI